MHPKQLLRIAFTVILLGIGGGGWTLQAKEKPFKSGSLKLTLDSTPIDRSASNPVSFSPVVKKSASSVVDVLSTKTVRVQNDMSQFFNDPIFRHFFGGPGEPQGGDGNARPHRQRSQSLGSGIIVSSDGYIITNNHVVEGADEVKVSFGEPVKEYMATVVAKDADTDVAVLKIDAKGLPTAALGDSDQLQVGDTVLAIGDPFGIGPTVTHGIVSALGRNTNQAIEQFEDFIQTDAPINPGNSGGALLDSQGRVIGINTAILSHSGGSNGVGFAIPINLVKSVAEQLVSTGKVERGFIGVTLEELTPDLAAQFGTDAGALVTDVAPGKPAERAGIKSGDIITKLNGQPIENRNQLQIKVSTIPPGTEIRLGYIRNGKETEVKLKLDIRPSTKALAGDLKAPSSDEGVLNGVAVSDLTPEIRDQLQLPASIKGAVVTEVDPDSGSAQAGIAQGDVILELDKQPVGNADEAVKLSAEIKGPKVLVKLWRRGASRYVVVDETKKGASEAAPEDQAP
jgi:serine protease Do